MTGVLRAFLFGVGLDAVVAAIFTAFADENEKILVFFFVLFLVIAVQWASALWAFCKSWLAFALGGKKRASRYYLAEMNRLKMPPTASYFEVDTYLRHAMADPGNRDAVRYKAALWMGEMEALKSTFPLSMGLMADSAFLDAMEKYHAPYSQVLRNFEADLVEAVADELDAHSNQRY